jgi:acetolactate synthase-1/2/3 large subunit
MSGAQIRVADYIASRCVSAGAKHVFLVTGGGAMHLNDAFGRNKNLAPVCFHHEQAAAIAAESYYRTSQRLAILNVTTGPGGINALNGVFGAYVDSIAMLVISGQVKRETYLRNYPIPLRQLGDQEVDILSMARPAVKYAKLVQNPRDIRAILDKAIFLSTYGRPGPVWVDVPIDVQGALIDPQEMESWSAEQLRELLADEGLTENTRQELRELSFGDLTADIKTIYEKFLTAKRPVIFAGNGVRLSGMLEPFGQLAERLGVPVVTGWNAHDLVPNDSPYYAGRPGTVGDRAGNFAVQNADFLMVLGCRLNIRQISYNWKSFANKAWKVMIDVDLSELEKPTLQIDKKIHSDLRIFIPEFNRLIDNHEKLPAHKNYLRWCRERVEKYPTVLPEYYRDKNALNPYVFVKQLFSDLEQNDIVVTGNGSACVIGFQAAELKPGQRLFTNSGNASMGYDLPAAIGAYLASQHGRIVCLAGDGSLMMNLQELQTVVGYNYPIKIIVLNNNGYQSIRQTQQAYFSDNMFGIGPGDGVSLPDFVKLANGFGLLAARVKSLDDWNTAEVVSLMNSSVPALIDVVVDTNQPFSPKLASRKMPDGTMVSPALEDMAPFLSREELSTNIIE